MGASQLKGQVVKSCCADALDAAKGRGLSLLWITMKTAVSSIVSGEQLTQLVCLSIYFLFLKTLFYFLKNIYLFGCTGS